MLRLVLVVVIMKRSKDHLFPRSQTDLRGILLPYAPKKKSLQVQQNWTLIRSAGLTNSLNTILYQLSSYVFWAPLLLWMALPFRQHFRTKLSSAKGTPSHSYVNAGTRTKSKLQPCPRMFSLSDLLLFLRAYLPLHQVFICGTHVLPRAASVLQYVLNQASWQRLPPDLKTYQSWEYWGVTLLRLLMFLKSLEQSLRITKQKENITTRV